MKLGWISCSTFGETVIHMVAAEPVQIVDKSCGSRGIHLISIFPRALDSTGTRATTVATNQILCNLIGEEGIKNGRHVRNCKRTRVRGRDGPHSLVQNYATWMDWRTCAGSSIRTAFGGFFIWSQTKASANRSSTQPESKPSCQTSLTEQKAKHRLYLGRDFCA